MKNLSSFIFTVLIILLSNSVSAQQVSFQITATVTGYDDMYNKLQGNAGIGQQITGTYTFELNVPDGDTSANYAHYDQTFTGANGFDLLMGSVSFKSDPSQPGYMHSIDIGNATSDHMHIGSWGNVPLADGTPVWDINLDLINHSGTALNNTNLTSNPPDINLFDIHDINISGNTFWLSAKIDSIQAVGGNTNPDLVTYSIDATVTWVNDNANILGGAISQGQNMAGSYTFNITTPDEDPDPMFGRYTHPIGSGDFGIDFSSGGLNFKSDPMQAPMQVELYNGDFNDNYIANSFGLNVPLANGAVITDFSIYMYDDSAQLISSDQLSTTAPVISTTGWYEIYIGGLAANGIDYFSINATINNISVSNPADPNLMIVSPASGLFDRFQMFDMGLIFAANLAPVDMNSFVVILNGMYQPLSGCLQGAYNSQNRQTFICPGLGFQLGSGMNFLTFKAQLMDGSVLQQSVEWQILGN